MAKRSSAADFFAPKSKISKEGRPVFLLAPSAGGTPPKEVLEVLKEIGKVHCLECSWPNKIFDSAKNVEKVLELAEEADAAAGPGATVWLCGTSFGCRVLVEVLSKHSHRLPASVKPGALLCLGFPLYGPSEASDRVRPLVELPAAYFGGCASSVSTGNTPEDPTAASAATAASASPPRHLHVTFVSGSKDEFLNRPYSALQGIGSLESVADRMRDAALKSAPQPASSSSSSASSSLLSASASSDSPSSTTPQLSISVVGIPGGKHNPIGVSKKTFLQAKSAFTGAINAHLKRMPTK